MRDARMAEPSERAPDRYELLELLGRGGMGEVDLLRDHRIGRDIARKRLHAREPSVWDVERFLREATLQGQLEHPAIAPVYDLARGAEGPFFTMKRIRGVTLEAILAEDSDQPTHLRSNGEAWSIRALLGAFVQVAQAVHYAHTRGVVHRDLKPSNVMLGEFGEVYVLDWGLAKSFVTQEDAELGERDGLQSTETGALVGTLGYVAPEQIDSPSAVTPAADVYALAAILFEIMTGAPLHPRINARQLLASTLLGVDVQARANALSAQSQLSLPPEFTRLIQSCVALEPEARTQHASELAQRVEQFLEGDRDLSLRLMLAEKHRANASALVRLAAKPGQSGEALLHRQDAIGEIGRALALDPSSESLRTLVSLLESPPEQTPPEVEAKLLVREKQGRTMLAQHSRVGRLALFPVLALALWSGIRSWVVLLALGAIAVFSAVGVRSPLDANARLPLSTMLLGTVFLAGASLVVGPFFFAPLVAMAILSPWMTVGSRTQRLLSVGLVLAALATPFLLAALGVFPMPYELIEGNLVIHPQLVAFTPIPTYALLVSASLAVVITTARFAGAFRDEVDRSTQEVELLTWHLRQLVPANADEPPRHASEPLPARPAKPSVRT